MKAVIFDLFETLVTEWGRPKYSTREISLDLGLIYEVFLEEWKVLQKDRYLGKFSDSKEAFRVILKKFGIRSDENLLDNICGKREEFKRKCFENIDPEIIRMLSVLKENSFKLGLISNCSAEETYGFTESGIYKYFDAVVLSCEAGLVKPDIKIYRRCLDLLNVQAQECYYAGDGGSNELNGAKNAGLTPLKVLWFIKNFVKDYDYDKTYKSFYEPDELTLFILGENKHE